MYIKPKQYFQFKRHYPKSCMRTLPYFLARRISIIVINEKLLTCPSRRTTEKPPSKNLSLKINKYDLQKSGKIQLDQQLISKKEKKATNIP